MRQVDLMRSKQCRFTEGASELQERLWWREEEPNTGMLLHLSVNIYLETIIQRALDAQLQLVKTDLHSGLCCGRPAVCLQLPVTV